MFFDQNAGCTVLQYYGADKAFHGGTVQMTDACQQVTTPVLRSTRVLVSWLGIASSNFGESCYCKLQYTVDCEFFELINEKEKGRFWQVSWNAKNNHRLIQETIDRKMMLFLCIRSTGVDTLAGYILEYIHMPSAVQIKAQSSNIYYSSKIFVEVTWSLEPQRR